MQTTAGVDSIIQQDSGESTFRMALVTPLMRRCHTIRSAGEMVCYIHEYDEIVLICDCAGVH